MRKQIIFIAFIFFAFHANAQKSEYPFIRNAKWGYYTYMAFEPLQKKNKISKAGISGYSKTTIDGKKEFVSAKVGYDKKGNCITYMNSKNNGKLKNNLAYQYAANYMVLSTIFMDSKGKEVKIISNKYDDRGNRIEEILIKKGKQKAKTISKFDSTRVLESYYYKNGKPDFKRKWVYTYYPDKSKKSSVIYNANGKIIYTWNYECKPEGELISKHKDTTLVCEKEEIDTSGNKVIITRKFNEKGKPYKIVYTYNKDDKLIQIATYHDNDLLSYKYKYRKETGDIEEFAYYNHKGKETYRNINNYDENNNVTGSKSYRKRKLISSTENQYNASNFLASMKYFEKGKLKNSYMYEYTYF